MKTISKTLAAATLGGLALASGATAQTAATPELTDAEKATIQQLKAVNTCMYNEVQKLEQAMRPYKEAMSAWIEQRDSIAERVNEQATAAADERIAAARDKLAAAAATMGLDEGQTDILLEQVYQSELQLLARKFASEVKLPERPARPDVQAGNSVETCFAPLKAQGITPQTLENDLNPIAQKIGPRRLFELSKPDNIPMPQNLPF